MATLSPGRLVGPFDDQIRYAAAAVAGPPVARREAGMLEPIRRDMQFGGGDYVAGTVRIEGVPARAYVSVYETRTKLLVAGGWTEVDGTFRFDGLSSTMTFFAIAFDPVSGERAVIYDRI